MTHEVSKPPTSLSTNAPAPSVRLHPVNDIVSRIFQAVPFVLLASLSTVVAACVLLLTFYAIFVQADVSWTFGPLRYIVATPLFRRWHHTRGHGALDKSFAGLLPLWDMLFRHVLSAGGEGADRVRCPR